MGPNAGLPESFTRNYDYPDLFVAVLEFCVAGIVAASINWFFRRPRKAQVGIQAASVPAQPAARPLVPPPQVSKLAPPISPTPARAIPAQSPAAPMASNRLASPDRVGFTVGSASKPAPAAIPTVQSPSPLPAKTSAPLVPPAPKAEPVKPKKEKPVYYNIVGEPVPDDED